MLGRTGLMVATAIGLLGAGVAAAAVPAAEFVKKAGASDLYEEQSSKLVLATTKDPKVKSFATMMIADHMKTTNGVKTAVRKSGMTPKPPMLEPKQQEMIAALKGKTGTARDALYVQQQKMAHQEALTLMQDYSASGDNPNLKQAATTAVPVVQSHIDKLSAM